jgi:uncharacterized protein DUF6941
MNLRAVFLAQEALLNQDGTFMVWRGGITELQSSAFPVLIPISLVLRIEADAVEARSLHHIRFRVVHSIESPWQSVPAAFKAPGPHEPRSYLNLLVTMRLGIVQPGDGHIEISIDDELIAPNIHFVVSRIPLPPGFPTS